MKRPLLAATTALGLLLTLPAAATAQLSFAGPADYATGDFPFRLAVGDLNGDADPDLAVANARSNTVSVLLGQPGGTFAAATSVPVGNDPRTVAIADFDGDSHADLAVANVSGQTVSVLLGNGDGSFAAPVTYAVGDGPTEIVAADFDGDGELDLAVTNFFPDTVSVLLGKGDGTFGAASEIASGADAPISVALGDVDGDPDPDLVIAHRSGIVSVLTGGPGASFTVAANLTVGDQPFGAGVGDFDGDTDLDVAATRPNSDNVAVLLRNRAPRADADAYVTDEDTPLAVTAPGVIANDRDVDGDAVTAALVSGPQHGSLELAPDGSFTYEPEPDYNGPDEFQYLAGDGRLESDAVTVVITVDPVDEPPPADPPAAPRKPRPVPVVPAPAHAGCGLTGNLLMGTDGDDRRRGGDLVDVVFGGLGDDVLSGLGGRDCLVGGAGRDRLYGGPGRDRLRGGAGRDRIDPGGGTDHVAAGPGNDRVIAWGNMGDTIDCGPGRDVAIVDRFDRVRNCERITVR